MSEPKTSGEDFGKGSSVIVGWFLSAVIGVAPVAMVVIGIGFDLWLGQVYMTAHAVEGVEDPGLRQFVPWAYTLATTGLQYAIIDRTRRGFKTESRWTKVLLLLGWSIAILDTLTDIGGFTAWFYGDNVQGANIMPDDPSFGWAFGASVLGFICLMHERLFQELLKRYKDKTETIGLPGAAMGRIGVSAAGWLLNIVKAVVMPVGIIAMVSLDIYLTPEFMGVEYGDAVGWSLSIILTVINFVLWEHIEKVGLKGLKQGARLVILVGWGFAIVDTLCDIAGYTTMVYGDGSSWLFIPSPMNLTWLITALIIGALCFAGEPLAKEAVRGSGKGGSKSSSSGSDDWGDWDAGDSKGNAAW